MAHSEPKIPPARTHASRKPTKSVMLLLGFSMSDEAFDALAEAAAGDARLALNTLELAAADTGEGGTITVETVAAALQHGAARYDRGGDQHYDVISAFIKSLRGSDVDAALHYLARMIEAGEDPRFIARRIIVNASEDVGMADPTALPVAVAAAQAVEFGAAAAVDHTRPFSTWVLAQTNGRGVDVVVDSLGATWPESIRSLARGGRLVVCGATLDNKPVFDIRELYQRHRSIHGAPMGSRGEFRHTLKMVGDGLLRPTIDSVFPLDAIRDAHARAESRESFGKIVVTI